MKNKKTKIIIGVVAAVLVVAFIIVYVVLHTPKMQLARGMVKLGQELSDYSSPVSEQLDSDTLQENMRNTPHTVSADMTITVPGQEDIDNINLTLEAGIDYGNRLAAVDFGVGAYQVTLAEGELILDDNTLYVSLPDLLSDVYSLQLDTFGADYQGSVWKDMLELDIDEDASFDFFAEEETETQINEAVLQAYEEAAVTMSEQVTIAKAPEKHDGYSGVAITLPKDAVNTFLDSMQDAAKLSDTYQEELAKLLEQSEVTDEQEAEEYLDSLFCARCKNDVEVYLYFDSDSRLRYVTTPEQIAFKDTSLKGITLEADFQGEERALDVISARLMIETTNGTQELDFDRNASVTDAAYTEDMTFDFINTDNTTAMTLRYENTWEKDSLSFDGSLTLTFSDGTLALSADGSYSDIVAGESYTLDLTTASIEIDGEALVRIAADVSVTEGMEEVSVSADATDLFDMDETALEEMLYEIVYGTIAKYL